MFLGAPPPGLSCPIAAVGISPDRDHRRSQGSFARFQASRSRFKDLSTQTPSSVGAE